MFIVVTYDIVCDKRRSRVAKTLEDYGTRVQYSVFECILDDKRMMKMFDMIKQSIDNKADAVRFYTLCKGCLSVVKTLGNGTITQDIDVIII